MLRKRYLSPNVRHAVLTRHGFLRFLGLDNTFATFKGSSWCQLPRTYHRYPHAGASAQLGFTLLEMLVVLGLLGIVMLGTTTLLIDDGDWKRQDETVKRWDEIRKAIIGEPNLSLNGSPYVAGYVADMGRLPQNISELFIQGEQPAWTEIEFYKKTEATNCITHPEDCFWLSGGWRGPYLYTAGSAEFRDGWRNVNSDDAADDAVNFGWNVSHDGIAPAFTDISVQSLGDDNAPDGDDYNQDFPDTFQKMVSLNEWTLTAPITFNIRFNRAVSAVATKLQLRIYRFEDSGDDAVTLDDDFLPEEKPDTTFNLEVDDTGAVQTLTPNGNLPVGRFAAVIWCLKDSPSPDVVYDGNCDAPVNHSPVYFTLTAHTTQVTIPWNLP